MKKMALMTVFLMVCLYLAGCGSPDRNQQGREQLAAQTQAADMAQAAGMEQESSGQMDGTQLAAEDAAALQEEAQDAQTEWDGQEEGSQETAGLVTIEDWKALPVGEYPITPDSPEWKTMSSSDAYAACNMPKEYAESLSSDDLSKYVGNYPFLGDIMMFNSIEDGINTLKERSTVIKELFSRPDCNAALLKEYTDLSCDYKILEEQNDMSSSRYMEQMFLEAYFGLNYANLSDEEIDTFLKEYEQKYMERPGDVKDFSTATMFYDCIRDSKGYVPEDIVIDSMKDKVISEYIGISTLSIGSYTYNGKTYQYRMPWIMVKEAADI
jgi:uncharacterized protein YceK